MGPDPDDPKGSGLTFDEGSPDSTSRWWLTKTKEGEDRVLCRCGELRTEVAAMARTSAAAVRTDGMLDGSNGIMIAVDNPTSAVSGEQVFRVVKV